MENILKINNLKTKVGEKLILKGLNIEINKGEIHVIMGPNGSGKSTFASTLMGHPAYEIESGEIIYNNENINNMPVEKRAKKGMFLAFQQPEEVDGVTLKNFLKTAKTEIENKPIKFIEFAKEIEEKSEKLNFDKSYSSRYLNVGFSGGEKKKSEMLQLLMLNPKLAILDEIDSGLDVDAVKIVSENLKEFHSKENSILIITHNSKLLEILKPDHVHILINGKVVKTGGYELIKEVEKDGFDKFRK